VLFALRALELLLLDDFFAAEALDVGRFDADTVGFFAELFEALVFDEDFLAELDFVLVGRLAARLECADRERATRSRPFQPTALSARNDAGIASTSP